MLPAFVAADFAFRLVLSARDQMPFFSSLLGYDWSRAFVNRLNRICCFVKMIDCTIVGTWIFLNS